MVLRRAARRGGCVIDLGIHLADMALWTLGFPEITSVSSRLFHNGGHNVEDYATAHINLANGTCVQLACSWNLPAGRDCVIGATFYGSRGSAATFRNIDGSFYDFVAERYDRTKTRTPGRSSSGSRASSIRASRKW